MAGTTALPTGKKRKKKVKKDKMGNILQDMMGMLTRKKIATPKTDDFITIARYATVQERLKPNPKIEAELVTMGSIKTFVNAGNSDSQQLSINGSNLSISNGNTVDLGDQEIKFILSLMTIISLNYIKFMAALIIITSVFSHQEIVHKLVRI